MGSYEGDRVIVAGSRSIDSLEFVEDAIGAAISSLYISSIGEIISGGARGVDACAERYAEKYDIPLEVFPADWDTHGKAAGPIRNRKMAEYGHILVAIWDGKSPGTKNMIEEAKKQDLDIYVYRC